MAQSAKNFSRASQTANPNHNTIMRLEKIATIRQIIYLILLPTLVASVAILPALADYPSTVLSLNPVGYWRLNEAAASVSASYTGTTATNASTLGATANGTYATYYGSAPRVGVYPGPVAGSTCAFFNPTNAPTTNYVEVPNTPALLTNTSMSIEMWVLRTNIINNSAGAAICGGYDSQQTPPTGFALFLDNANGATNRNYYLRLRQGTGGTTTGIANFNYNSILFGLKVHTNVGNWDHVVFAWDQTNIQSYINGVALTSTNFASGQWYVPNADRSIRFGVDSKGAVPGSICLNTWLAQAAIYPYVLTYNQVTNHFAATNSAANYKATILADNPVGYWPLNEMGSPPTVIVTNLGTWGAGANGSFTATVIFNTGQSGVPYMNFGGSTCAKFPGGAGNSILVSPQSLVTNEFTVTLWHKIAGNTGGDDAKLFDSPGGVAGCGPGYRTASSSGMVNNSLGVTTSSTTQSAVVPDQFMPSNQWAFVAMVAKPTETVLYVNGVPATNTSVNLATPHDFSLTNLFLGGAAGYLSDVALYDHALTPSQIAQIYAAAGVTSSPTTLKVSASDVNGNFTISGTASRGQTATLWQSTDLTLGVAGWTAVMSVNSDAVTGQYSFPLNQSVHPQAFYQVK